MKNKQWKASLKKVCMFIEEIAHEAEQDEITGPIIREAASSRGKMLRPRLLLLCAWMLNEKEAYRHREQLCRWGAIIELAHMTSLIHDDVIDESIWRRGQETLNKKYGAAVAVYAGDYLLARLLHVVLEEQNRAISLKLTKAVERMCKGEIGQFRYRYQAGMSVSQYEWNIAGKTGIMFETCFKAGAMVVGATADEIRDFTILGRKIGRAFQLRDDLLDFVSDDKTEGKQIGVDFKEGIYTLPVLLARDHKEYSKEMSGLMEKSALGTLKENDMIRLKEIVTSCGAIEVVRQDVNLSIMKCRRKIRQMGSGWAQEEMDKLLKKLEI